MSAATRAPRRFRGGTGLAEMNMQAMISRPWPHHNSREKTDETR
jgi:hypothetical protein